MAEQKGGQKIHLSREARRGGGGVDSIRTSTFASHNHLYKYNACVHTLYDFIPEISLKIWKKKGKQGVGGGGGGGVVRWCCC